MNLKKLDEILNAEPGYRKKQVWHFVFQKLINDWDEATSLPAGLRDKLKEEVSLEINSEMLGEGGARKALIRFEDDLAIETVLMQHKEDRNTVCVSSQVGCSLGCTFCATGKMGLMRSLTLWEIIEQVLFFSRLLKEKGQKVTNIVYMGMGEPMLNYEAVVESIKFLNKKETLNLGARRFSVSTVGVVDGINRLADEDLDINLAISLHATTDQQRGKMMPINEQWNIKELLTAIDRYIEKKNRRVMVEYVLIKGENDTEADAERLVRLLKGKLCFVNLIIYNKTQDYEPPEQFQIDKFRKVLDDGGLSATQRYGFGNKIEAACGQLAINKNGA